MQDEYRDMRLTLAEVTASVRGVIADIDAALNMSGLERAARDTLHDARKNAAQAMQLLDKCVTRLATPHKAAGDGKEWVQL